MVRLLLVLVVFCSCGQAHFFDKHSQGWFWYEKNVKQNEKSEKPPEDRVKYYQQELTRLQQIAWLNPTTANVRRYIKLQNYVMEQSSKFANAWKYVVMQNPELDHTTKFPVNQQGRQVYLEKQATIKNSILQKISKEYGLFYFYKGNCQYCHLMSPVVKRFAKTYGWEVVAISMDGAVMQDFANAKLNKGQAESLGIKVVPALIAVNPKTKHMLPLAYGFTAEDEIANRAMQLIEFQQQRTST